ncbi:MAG: hypothetical protein HDS03_04445 [Bacteroides sp.]|nr:hypothetical protein [Bacteroides sp.]
MQIYLHREAKIPNLCFPVYFILWPLRGYSRCREAVIAGSFAPSRYVNAAPVVAKASPPGAMLRVDMSGVLLLSRSRHRRQLCSESICQGCPHCREAVTAGSYAPSRYVRAVLIVAKPSPPRAMLRVDMSGLSSLSRSRHRRELCSESICQGCPHCREAVTAGSYAPSRYVKAVLIVAKASPP